MMSRSIKVQHISHIIKGQRTQERSREIFVIFRRTDNDYGIRDVFSDHGYDLTRILQYVRPVRRSVGFITYFKKEVRAIRILLRDTFKEFLCLSHLVVWIPILKHMPVYQHISIRLNSCHNTPFQQRIAFFFLVTAVYICIHSQAEHITIPVVGYLAKQIFIQVVRVPGKSMRTDTTKLNYIP